MIDCFANNEDDEYRRSVTLFFSYALMPLMSFTPSCRRRYVYDCCYAGMLLPRHAFSPLTRFTPQLLAATLRYYVFAYAAFAAATIYCCHYATPRFLYTMFR